MYCKLCGQDKKAAKSHIIPEAFFREIKIEGKKLILRSNCPDTLPKSAPIGIYDQTILCHDCEATFNSYDDYGIKVLAKEYDKLFKSTQGLSGAKALKATGVDAKRLLGFLLSVLWRAAVSSHIFYSRVALGPFEPILKKYIQEPDSGIPECFDAFLYKWIPPEKYSFVSDTIVDPAPTKLLGVNLYKFYLANFVAVIKVDSRPLPTSIDGALLSKSDDFLVMLTEMHRCGDLHTIVKTAKQSQKNLEYFRKMKKT